MLYLFVKQEIITAFAHFQTWMVMCKSNDYIHKNKPIANISTIHRVLPFLAPHIEKERTKGNSSVSITGSRSWLLRNSHIRWNFFPEISDLPTLSSILTDDDYYNYPQQTGIRVHMRILKLLSIWNTGFFWEWSDERTRDDKWTAGILPNIGKISSDRSQCLPRQTLIGARYSQKRCWRFLWGCQRGIV